MLDSRLGGGREPILAATLSVRYGVSHPVLDQLDLTIGRGEIVGLVGESGSGKSTLALALMKLLDPRRSQMSGHVSLNGRDLIPLTEKQMRRVRGSDMSLVLQSAGTALNPVLRIGSHFEEAWLAHRPKHKSEWKDAAFRLLDRVCLPRTDDFLRRYPGEVSIGQAQRVLIALALLHRPALLIADEPTSALDAITHAEILDLFRTLNADLGLSILLISHDLLSVASLCSRLAILRKGRIVETGSPETIFSAPENEYTQRLIGALPRHPLSDRRPGSVRAFESVSQTAELPLSA